MASARVSEQPRPWIERHDLGIVERAQCLTDRTTPLERAFVGSDPQRVPKGSVDIGLGRESGLEAGEQSTRSFLGVGSESAVEVVEGSGPSGRHLRTVPVPA